MSGPGPIAVDPQLVNLGARQVRLRVSGDGDPLLLFNGLTRPLESWEPFTQALHGRTVISFDAPGVGGSPTPLLPMSISMLAALAASLLDQLGLDRADVLGFSHGGAVAQQLAAQTPGKVRRLVLVSTSCGMGATPGGAQGALRGRPKQSEGPSWPQPNPLGMLWHSLAIASWSSIPFLGAITMPTLVVSGAHDRVVPPENSSLLARRIPGAELVLLPAGHDLQRRGPASALAGVVESFLVAGSELEPLRVGG
jgi:poly(3-hydroxyoctanoate) depolymerase